MATATLKLVDSQTWIYPPQSYLGYDGIYKKQNHWYNGHSMTEWRGRKLYQSGNSETDGRFNGNMMSFLFFKDGNGKTMRQVVNSIGGSGKITKITLKVTCAHSWYSAMNLRVCLSPYSTTTGKWGSGGLTECPYDNYDSLKIKHIKTEAINKGQRKSIDLTAWKKDFEKYENINMYVPGGYNKDYHAYGWIYGHIGAGGNLPELVIEYTTNSAPYTPNITIHTQKDSSGYITPALNFSVVSNGDPDNALHPSSPYAWELYNQSGGLIAKDGYYGWNNFSYDLSSYRGQTVKIRGKIRDNGELSSHKDTNVYINSQPYFNNTNVDLTSGVNNGVYKNNVTISWNGSLDNQPEHKNNLRYYIHCQKGDDKGPSGDTEATRIASGLTGTSHTFDAASMTTANGGRITVAKGERIYLSVWSYDGLEWSTNRCTSQWIYREQPPSTPTNVSPTGGHYESNVDVSWSASQGINGTWITKYKVDLLNSSGGVVKTYYPTSASMTCYDIGLIGRGSNFTFRVVSIDNLNNHSTSISSGVCRRNSAPSTPLSFKTNSSSEYFKNSIPLIWSASNDRDGDTIKYNVYFNINNGGYQELVRGTTGTSCNHNITGFGAGTLFNYYIEAYDTYNVYSDKRYIAVRPQVNTPPEAPNVLKPFADRTLYTNIPRIIFKTNKIYNTEKVKVTITVNGISYNSVNNSTLFNKQNYGSNEEAMFILPNSAPLAYSRKNSISIKCSDIMDESSTSNYNIPVDACLVSKIRTDEDRIIKASEFESLKAMINENRFAYNIPTIGWTDGKVIAGKTIINKQYFKEVVDGIHSLTTHLNDLSKANHLTRMYDRNAITKDYYISELIFNNIIEMIIAP